MAEKCIVLPAVEPVTLAEAKAQMIVETSAYDALITSKIRAAREWVEDYLGRALVAQTWRTQFDWFPGSRGVIRLNRSPLQSVTSIEYIDDAGDTQTLDADAYVVDTTSEPARITPAPGYSWPSTQNRAGAVTITAVHGYDGTGDSPLDLTKIPQAIKEAILILATDLYQNREMTVNGLQVSVRSAAESLLFRHRVVTFTE